MSDRIALIEATLTGYPAAALAAALRFEQDHRPEDLRRWVEEVLLHLLPLPAAERPDRDALHDELHLTTDLGFDSIGMVELHFLLEDLFGSRLDDDELRGLATLGDLQRAVARLVLADGNDAPG